ncbi:endonuclease/exonuclease/phosphatase family protein [Spiractinospora alimapuensis]|uniref:endonuclease/exonuclease/phosphatase family protein n=1 Tax=Spiractinospora alimapuensis TaxID=2820884 RepID=UPI001F351120|nr:endonuclease/exonuclease/phosphatase family protein [Spiractinospora alimapuensis]QVQ52247.1 endonuclease/exonuclease/phosphatase family protein [Spiractinospora alimapuensis]
MDTDWSVRLTSQETPKEVDAPERETGERSPAPRGGWSTAPASPRRLWPVLLLVPWVVWSVIRVTGTEVGFPLVPAISFTPYAAATSVIPLVVALLLRRWWLAGLAFVTAAALAACVLPRLVADGQEGPPAEGPELRVLTVNMEYGQADASSVVELAREAEVDVLSVQELTDAARDRLLAAGLDDELGHEVSEPMASGPGGSGLYARFPLREVTQGPVPGFAMPMAALSVPGAGEVEVMAVHPVPPVTPSRIASWQGSFDALPPAGAEDRLRVLAGDFNATLDHARMRELLASGYVDAASVHGQALDATWPIGRPYPPLSIDHVLVDERITVDAAALHEFPDTDHRGVLAELRLPEG